MQNVGKDFGTPSVYVKGFLDAFVLEIQVIYNRLFFDYVCIGAALLRRTLIMNEKGVTETRGAIIPYAQITLIYVSFSLLIRGVEPVLTMIRTWWFINILYGINSYHVL